MSEVVRVLDAWIVTCEIFEGRRKYVLGLAGAATNLGEQQVDTEGTVLVVEVLLELSDLLAEHVGSVTDTTNDTETSGVGDGSSQLGAGGDVHTSQEDRVLDLEKIRDGCTNLLYRLNAALAICATVLSSAKSLVRFVGRRRTESETEFTARGEANCDKRDRECLYLRGEAIVTDDMCEEKDLSQE